MKRFTFRLQSLLDIRRRTEDEIKNRIAHKNTQINETAVRLKELGEELTNMQRTQLQRRSGPTDVVSLRLSVSYRYTLKSRMAETIRFIDTLKKEREEIRGELVEARRAVRAIELLRERQFAQWKKKYERTDFSRRNARRGI